MKEFIKKWILVFGLVSISATVIPAIVNRSWGAFVFMLQLLLVLFIFCLLQALTGKLPLKALLYKYLVDLSMALIIVLLFGRIWKWYEPAYAWMMPAMIIPVFIVGYFLDLIKVKKDVDFINRQIVLRRERKTD